MKNPIRTLLTTTLLVALPALLLPGAVSAQAQCEAELTPTEIPAGEAAFQVTADFSEQVGAITMVETAGGSGLAMASPEDIPRADLAAGDEAPRPITMANEGNSATIWLNSQEAEAGTTYQITLQGDSGSCTAELSVAGGGN